MSVIISEDILSQASMTAEQLLIEIAVHLYDLERLTMGQARNLARLDQISFQREMAKRNVYIKYDMDDLETDLQNLKDFHRKK